MKSVKILFTLATVFFLLCITSCQTAAKSPVEIIDETSEEVAEPISTSMSQLWFWSKSEKNSYNPDNGELTVAGIPDKWNAFTGKLSESDAKGNNFLEIKYSNPSKSFTFKISYTDGESSDATSAACESVRTVKYIPLNRKFKNKIERVEIITNDDGKDLSVKIDSLKFVKEQILPAPVIDNETPVPFNSDISAIDFAKKLKTGWNLGNDLDAYSGWLAKGSLDSELSWGEPRATEEIISIGINNGMKTIRIPVTWANHIVDENYTIDGDWMSRVKTIVNWAIEDGYYVILNEHHSVNDKLTFPLEKCAGYNVSTNKADIAESEAFLKAVWTQISAAFNNSYDEHLIFETMNEPRDADKKHNHTWAPALKTRWCDNRNCKKCLEEYKIFNEYNQICLDTIRSSGGNNANRFVLIPALCTGIEPAKHELFKMPEDSANDKLILTVHDYRLKTGTDYTISENFDKCKTEIDEDYEILYEKFISKGIPVVVGETGAANRYPLEVRVNWIKYFGSVAKNYGMPLIYWECGDTSENSMSLFDRNNGCVRPEQLEFVKAFTAAFD